MILYLETNFLMAVATGREARHEELFRFPPERLRLCMPAVCVMEALSASEDERTRRSRLRDELQRQLGVARRDLTSLNAAELAVSLDQALTQNQNLASEIVERLFDVLALVAGQKPGLRGAELLPLTPALLAGADLSLVPGQPTDSLIVATILGHARAEAAEPAKAFLSGNTRDFDGERGAVVRELLRENGIEFFSRTESVLGRLSAAATA